MEQKIPIQVVLTKCDLVRPWKLHQTMETVVNLGQQLNGNALQEEADRVAKAKRRRNSNSSSYRNERSDLSMDPNFSDEGPYVPIYPYIHAVSALHDTGMQELRVSLASVARDEENVVKMERMH